MNSRISRRRSLALLCSLLAVSAASAQAKPAAVVEYASSDDVVVIRAGRPVVVDDPFGMDLFQGDTVQTGRSTLLEIRMVAGGAVFKLAENTTFVLNKAEAGETKLSLIYGRLRAKVDKLSGNDSFTVVAASATAGVRGTDFGVDVLASRSMTPGIPETNIYCFEGSIQVVAMVTTLASSKERLESIPRTYSLGPGQMVTVSRKDDVMEATSSDIAPEIKEFWSGNEFTGGTVPAQPAVAAVSPEAGKDQGRLSEQERMNLYYAGHAEGYERGKTETQAAFEGFISAAEAERLRIAASNQRGALVAGALVACVGSGLSLGGTLMTGYGDSGGAVTLSQAGAIISAMSLPFFALALFLGPR